MKQKSIRRCHIWLWHWLRLGQAGTGAVANSMRCRACAQVGGVARGADQTGCTPTSATIFAAAGASAGLAASRPGSPGAAFRAARGSSTTAGLSSASWPDWPASAACLSATGNAPTSDLLSSRLPATSSAELEPCGCVPDSWSSIRLG